MKLHAWTVPTMIILNRAAGRRIVGLCLLACTLSLEAQQVVTPSAPSSPPPTLASIGRPGPAGALPIWSPLQWGPIMIHPRFSYRLVYGDGIQSSPGQQSKTAIHTLSPGFLFTLGTQWSLDYAPTQTYYSNDVFKDTLGHTFNLSGSAAYDDWIFQFSQSFASSSDPRIETGRQTSEKTFGTGFTAGYRFNTRMQLDTIIHYGVRLSGESFTDSREWTGTEQLHYKYSQHLDFALGIAVGYADMNVGSDMTYTRPQAQVTWIPSDKLTFAVRGGGENRKFRSGDAADLNNPTYGASLQYKILEHTSVSFEANRGVGASYFQDQVTENTDWRLNLSQRLFQRFQLSTGFSQQKSDYVATDSSVSTQRSDKNYSFNINLSTVLVKRASVAISYQKAHNASNSAGFGFSSSQVGLELAWRF